MIPVKLTFASAGPYGQAIPNGDIGQVYFESGTVYFTDAAGVNGASGLLKHSVFNGGIEQLQPSNVQITGFDYGGPDIISTPASLSAGDTNSVSDIYYRWSSNVTQLTNGDADSSHGQYVPGVSGVTQGGVAFESKATNLLGAGADTNGVADIYFRPFATNGGFGSTLRLSTVSSGAEANGASFNLEAADSQPFLIFGSDATNLLGDGHAGLFWKDLGSGTLARASATSEGAPIDGVNKGDISATGRFVVFDSDVSSAVSGDTNGVRDVFMKDMQTGALTRVSTNSDGSQLGFATSNAAVSFDGRYVAFEGAPSGGATQIFVKDTTTGELARITSTQDGQPALGSSHIVDFSGSQLLFRSDAGGLIAGLDAGGLYLANIGSGYVTRSGMMLPSTTFTMPAGIDDVSLGTGYAVTGNELGNVFSLGSDDTVSGAAGDDTFRLGRAGATLTGGAGADTYVLDANPYAPSTITDFKIGEDELDLSAPLAGYRGTNPTGDGYIRFESDGAGGTKVYVDRDGSAGSGIPIQLTTLKDVPVSSVTYANVTDRHDASGDHEAVISSSIRGTGSNGSGVTVNEFALPTHPEGDAQSSWLYLTAPDGIDDLTAAGHAVITDGVFSPTSFITPEGNRLAFTGFDTGTGQLTYTYTLLTSQYHPYTNGSADVYLRQVINLQLTDRDGDVGAGTITVSIQDAWPSLGTDIDLVPQGSTTSTGNVIRGVGEADTAQYGDGHDSIPLEGGKIVRLEVVGGTRDESFDANGNLEVVGQYGTLSLNRNGDYTYTLNSNVPVGVTDKFRYWMQDGDARPLQDYAGIEFRITQPGSTGGGETSTPSDQGYISFTTSSSTGAEGNSGPSPITFTVHRGGTGAGAASVNWAVTGSGDHPADAADFAGGVLPSGTISFADGETNKTLIINAAGDTTLESNETFTVTLSNATGAGYIAPPYLTAIGTIGNDDAAQPSGGQVYTSPGPGSTVTGGDGDDTINASQGQDVLTGGAGHDTFAWAREPWAPATVTDFVVGTDRIDLSALFRTAGYTGSDPVADHYISLTTDSSGTKILFDRDGTATAQQWPNYIINLQGVTGQVTWAQLSGGPPPASPTQFSLDPSGPFYQPEGNSGATTYSFLVSRSGSTTASGSVTWGVNLNGFTATASDFVGGAPAGGTVTFAPGESQKIISVQVAGDTTIEGDETFGVFIANPQGGAIRSGGSSLMATIKNDDDGTPPTSNPGQDLYAYNPGATVTGGTGDDTIHGSQSSDLLTGGAGADKFTWAKEPWSPGTITDFTVGTDRLDLSSLFQSSGYAGTDPVADRYITLLGQGSDTLVLFDRDGAGTAQQYGNYIIKLQGVSSGGLTWAQLSGSTSTGGGGTSEPPPPPPPPPSSEGQVLTSDQYGDTLVGGSGADTINAGQGPDQMTGGGGGDHFVFRDLPWNAGRITDFDSSVDKLDVSALFRAYPGGSLQAVGDGHGGVDYFFDRDGAGGDYPFKIVHIDGFTPSASASPGWIIQ